jgi:glycosyltransferase-like protein
MLTYSTRPRGGVVHAIEVSRALAACGHLPLLVALAPPGGGFFREPGVPYALVRHEAREAGFDERVLGMLAAYREGLAAILRRHPVDVLHAQDCLSANAALDLRDAGLVPRVLRTVHHVDDFTSPSLVACQNRSIREPDALLCVSPEWVERLRDDFGVEAGLVRNGVDTLRFRPPRDAAERRADRERAGVAGRLAVLGVGGIEPRKGSVDLVDGFGALRRALPGRDPVLILAGGATLFDYRHEIGRFHRRAEELGVSGHVRVLGPVPDAELWSLYRAADVMAFPSLEEGFGLVALEALSAGLPLVATDIPVFRGFLRHAESALLVPPGDGAALGAALARAASDPRLRATLRAGGARVVARFSWDRAAAAHERAYSDFLRPTVPAA